MNKINVGITTGDLNGVGLETIIKTFSDNRMMEFCTPIIFGSPKVASAHRRAIEIHDFSFNIITNINEANPKRANLLNLCKDDIKITFGKSSPTSGKYSLNSLTYATNALKKKQIDVLVTGPINKASIQENVPGFIGHTEFLEGNFNGDALMIMISNTMKISFVTGHIPLIDVKKEITTEKIISKTKILNDCLKKDFGIRCPKIAILGLNPHAGEDGLLGNEEEEEIIPAITTLNKNGIVAFGPYPADSFFTNKNLTTFDAILAMYHDQGLTPFKTLSFDDGVNYTAGLNIVRTSPVHGTAYEIAGKGIASEQSFREAVFLACDIHKKRHEFDLLNKNRLGEKN